MSTASPSLITNYCYEDITLDQTVSVSRTITADDITLFAALSGDLNPVHLDADYAATTPFGKRAKWRARSLRLLWTTGSKSSALTQNRWVC